MSTGTSSGEGMDVVDVNMENVENNEVVAAEKSETEVVAAEKSETVAASLMVAGTNDGTKDTTEVVPIVAVGGGETPLVDDDETPLVDDIFTTDDAEEDKEQDNYNRECSRVYLHDLFAGLRPAPLYGRVHTPAVGRCVRKFY